MGELSPEVIAALKRDLARCDEDRRAVAAATGRDEADSEWCAVIRLDRFRLALAALERIPELEREHAALLNTQEALTTVGSCGLDAALATAQALDEASGRGERVGPLLSAAELAAILRHELWTEDEQAALVRHFEAQDSVIANQNAEMDRQAGVVEGLTAQLRQALRERDEARAELSRTQGQMIEDLHILGELLGHERAARPHSPQAVLRMWTAEVGELVAEVRRLLFLYDGPFGGTDIERRSAIGIDQCPRIAVLLTPAARPEGT